MNENAYRTVVIVAFFFFCAVLAWPAGAPVLASMVAVAGIVASILM